MKKILLLKIVVFIVLFAVIPGIAGGYAFAMENSKSEMNSAVDEENAAVLDACKSLGWSLTDGLGRTATEDPEQYPLKSDKYVVIFYHIWHKTMMSPTVASDSKAPRNITRIISENEDALTNSKYWGPEISYHYWGEPLFGYYDIGKDEYVVRAHARMLCDAGVDAIVLDYTNFMGEAKGGAFMGNELRFLLDTYLKIREEGGKTPCVSMLLTWDAKKNGSTCERLYKEFYSDEKYDELWFRWEGKPLILGSKQYVSKEISGYFTFRTPHAQYTSVSAANTWPWLSIYPQSPGYTTKNKSEIVAVSVAQNWTSALDFMSAVNSRGMFSARGRSYTVGGENKLLDNPVSSEYGSQYGANFQQQFDRAIELDPSVIFVTGWNEWIAARFLSIPSWALSSHRKVPAFGGFCDVFTSEFSRDIEPTRDGGLEDHFYNQLAENIRKFKGVASPEKGMSKKIDVSADFSQWENVFPEYTDNSGKIIARDSKGIGKVKYENSSNRNDIVISKVTYDSENLYFYVRTDDAITSYTDPDWMLLYISTGSEKNWEGFDYVINRVGVRKGFTTLERSAGGYSWEVLSDEIRYGVLGNELQISVSRALMGLDTNDEFSLCFKWADNVCAEGDPLNFYLNGDTSPGERFMYRFIASGATEAETEPSGSVTETAAKGLPKVLIYILSAVAAAAATVAAVFLIKNKKDK